MNGTKQMNAIKLIFSTLFKTFFLSLCIVANVHFAYAQQGGIIPNGKATFLDQNGKPLSSGKVYFYIPSTTTPKTTYSDINLTIPNTQPVSLDAAGRAILWGTGVYRQQVYDKNNNLIWDTNTSISGTGGTAPTATGDGDLVGTIKPWPGITAPNQYAFTYGQELSRSTYSSLFTAITSSQNIGCTSGSPTITGLTNTDSFWVGMGVEVACVSGGNTTVASKTSFTVTLAVNANATQTTTATFFMWGRGNGSTTFNLPDFRGLIPVGNNIMGGVASANISDTYFGTKLAESAGAQGGSSNGGSFTLGSGNIPTITSTNATQNITVVPGGGRVVPGTAGAITSVAPGNGGATLKGYPATSAGGSGDWANVGFSGTNSITTTYTNISPTAFGIIPAVKTVNYIIKITPDANSATASGVTDIQGMTGSIACGSGLTCTGNIITSTGSGGAPGGSTGNLQYNNAGVFGGFSITAGAPAIGSAGSPNLAAGTKSGNTTTFATTSGSLVANNCVKVDASGNLVDFGGACGGSGSPAGSSGNIQYNNAGSFGGFSITAGLPVIGSAGSPNLAAGAKSGNTNTFATTTGSLPAGNCAKFDASGNIIDNGSACSGGSGTPGGTNGQIQYNNTGAFAGFTPTANLPLIGSASSPNIATGTRSGNTTSFATTSGSLTSGNCAKFDASGNVIDSGASCSTTSNYVSPYTYGALCDGVTNDAVALQNMINASSGKTIFMPAATCITNSTLTLVSGTNITGAGREASVLKCNTSPSICIYGNDITLISLTNFQMLGTNSCTTWISTCYGPIAFFQDGSSARPNSHINIQYMKFINFNSNFWFVFSATGSANGFDDINFSNNLVFTDGTSIPTDPTTSNNSNSGILLASNSGGIGQNTNIQIKNNIFSADGMCFPITLRDNNYKWQISDNLIIRPGQLTPHHCDNGGATTINSYGIAIYDSFGDGNPPQNGIIANNNIISPYASGIYFAGDGNTGHYAAFYNSSQTTIIGNTITGQTSSDDVSIPRAAIAINLSTDINVIGNYLKDNWGGIAFSSQTAGTVSAIGNQCTSGAGGGNCIKLVSGRNGSSNIDKRIVKGNSLEAVSSTILISSSSGARFYDLDISDNFIVTIGTGLSITSNFIQNSLSLTGNKIVGSGTLSTITSNIILDLSIAGNIGIEFTVANLPTSSLHRGSNYYVSDGTGGSNPCTGSGGGATAFFQNGASKCF